MSRFIIINKTVQRNCALAVQALPLDQYEVVIREKKRSQQANSLYWVWVGIIADVKGYTADDMHEAFKLHFLGTEELHTPFGVIVRPKSSSKLRKKEFSDYMRKVEAYGQEEGIVLPSPDYYGLQIEQVSRDASSHRHGDDLAYAGAGGDAINSPPRPDAGRNVA